MKIKTLIAPLAALALAIGVGYYLFKPEAAALGTHPGGNVEHVNIGEISEENAGQTVAIHGRIKTLCPTTGCWAVIEDGSGEIRIDTQKGGFALPPRSLGSRIDVVGEVELAPNRTPQISAEWAEL